MPKKKYVYAVREGMKTGIFDTWDECNEQINGYQSPVFRKFCSIDDARVYLLNHKIADEIHPDNILKGIKFHAYNPDTDYDISKWTKYNNEYYFFTDGSFKKKNKIVKTSYSIYIGSESMNIAQKIVEPSNNRCELIAINHSLNIIKKKCKELKSQENPVINIVSDSEYATNSCTKWIHGWVKNNWNTVQSKPVLNSDLFKSILLIINMMKLHSIKVNFVHTRSHQPPPLSSSFNMMIWKGNQVADLLSQYMTDD
jgi:ribonuclease HI